MSHSSTTLHSFIPKLIHQWWLALVVAVAVSAPAQAQPEEEYHSEATLIAENTSIAPAKPFTVALRVQIDKDWHIYWSNPGDTGLATRITWSLPTGFKVGNLRYSYPKRFTDQSLVSYGYEDEVWLLSEITPPANLPVGKNVGLNGKAQWLACNESCIPASADLQLSLPVTATPPTPDANWKAAFAEARKQLPVPAHYTGYAVQTKREAGRAKDAKAKVIVQLTPADAATNFSDAELKQLYFFSAATTPIAPLKPQIVKRSGQGIRLVLSPSEYLTESLKRLRGVLVAPEGKVWGAKHQAKAIWIDSAVAEAPTKVAAVPTAAQHKR